MGKSSKLRNINILLGVGSHKKRTSDFVELEREGGQGRPEGGRSGIKKDQDAVYTDSIKKGIHTSAKAT